MKLLCGEVELRMASKLLEESTLSIKVVFCELSMLIPSSEVKVILLYSK